MTDPQHGDSDAVSIEDLARRLGVPAPAGFDVERVAVALPDSGQLSALRWGEGEPRVVLIHGGGQNAHTWDAVVVALGHPAIAIDLPGHGHSTWRDDRDYGPSANARAAAWAIDRLAPRADLVVGMSLGGLTSIRLRATRPDLVRSMVLVDVTPSSGQRFLALDHDERGAVALLDEDRTFASFEEMYAATARRASGRDPEVLRRGVAYNSKQLETGRWTWRYDDLRNVTGAASGFAELWDDLAAGASPVTLAVAANAGIVSPADEAKFSETVPQGTVVRFDTPDHSIQSVYPRELAELIRSRMRA